MKTCPAKPGLGALLPWWCLGLFLASLLAAPAQTAPKVAKVEVKFVGPANVGEELIRANIRLKLGETYASVPALQAAMDDDVKSLYGTGFFYNIQVSQATSPDGLVLTYIVQGKPKLTEIKIQGNKKYSEAKIQKKLTSKVGEPLDERKLFTDCQEIQKLYQKAGYPRTEVKYVLNIDEGAGRGGATIEIKESPKSRILLVEFEGAKAFTEKQLRKKIKTRKYWMFSWLTGSGYLKDDKFEEDKEALAEFYRDNGYIDFEIKDVEFLYPEPNRMIIRFKIFEGRQYRVGSVAFSGNKIFSTNEIAAGMVRLRPYRGARGKVGPNGLDMDVGDVFSPKGLAKDIEAVQDFYGSKGYIDVTTSSRNLIVSRIPNTETGTMDLEFKLDEGRQFNVEKIEIRGNTKTKDYVIRREMAVSPGEVFDMVRVKVSKNRLEGLQYFEKIDTRAESPEPAIAGRKNLVVSVDEKNTGNMTMGAGFSSVDSIVGFVEVSQGNFDLFNPPTFTGGGQKFRLRVQIGTERQDYVLAFIEPWFLGRKLSLGVDLYHRDLGYQSVDNLYDETRTGGRISLTRALGSDFLIGGISYTLENVGIDFNSGAHPTTIVEQPGGGSDYPNYVVIPGNTPQALWDEAGNSLISKVGFTLAYDTRNSVLLPNHGQRTEVTAEVAGGPLGGEKDFYKLDLRTAWYFKGFFPGHVLEVVARTGIAEAYGNTEDVPFYERYYLGGLYSLRGYEYRTISPREPGISEPIGGDTYWFGSLEYSIPIIERVRVAIFYDIGDVQLKPYTYKFGNYTDNFGFGLRLNLPIGPLRLDYGIPISYDPEYQDGKGQFQFGVGYTREF
jgi:outer membrane protein insertion porin family